MLKGFTCEILGPLGDVSTIGIVTTVIILVDCK